MSLRLRGLSRMPINVTPLVPAAQYLRMSTDVQQYSIPNQKSRIQEYAYQNGFEIVKTYEDPGKIGVTIKKTKGLSGLLKEVVSGDAKFKAKPEAYHLIRLDHARRSTCLRRELCDQLTRVFPENVKVIQRWRGSRSMLRIDDSFTVSILFCRREKPHRQYRPRNARGRPFTVGPYC